jgi:GntR family transcriptional regulator/MocR family aminotransferase
VIEDDYDAEYRYDRQPVGSLQGLDPDHVLAFGTVSKSLAPFLRLGWIVVPGPLAQEIAAEKEAIDRATPGLDQAALAEMIRSGRYDRHLRRMRGVYSRRRQALIDAVAKHAPECEVSGLEAGFHAVIETPDGVDEHHVVSEARRLSVRVGGMSAYRFDGSPLPCQLVLGFGNLTEAAIDRGIATIAHLLKPGSNNSRPLIDRQTKGIS